MRDNHFVVVTACNQREVTIIDNHARYKMTLDDFGNIWKGYALVFTK
ncbi:MAG: cysteine peptidase family C39 domain-containing protein [bacterium]